MNHRFARVIAAGIFVAGTVMLAGCNDHITVDRDPSIPIQRGQTWAWRPAPSAPQAKGEGRVISRDVILPQPTLETKLVRDRLKIAFQQTLASKGLVQVDDPSKADFLVDFNVGVQRRQARVATPVYPPAVVCGYYGCWQSWGYWGPAGYVVRNVQFHEGTLVFSLSKANDGRLAFRAISQKVVTPETFSPRQVNEAVKRLLKELKPNK
jgi:Domain of unknown function (DUF4136)